MERRVLGSTAEQLIRSAACSVFTVGPHAKQPPPLFFERIVYATEGVLEVLDNPYWSAPIPAGSPRRLGQVSAHDALWTPNGKLIFAKAKDTYTMPSCILEADECNAASMPELRGYRGPRQVHPERLLEPSVSRPQRQTWRSL
jgi:hypothetical protein